MTPVSGVATIRSSFTTLLNGVGGGVVELLCAYDKAREYISG